MGHDIKRIADDEWESGNPIDFRGTQTKNQFVQRAWSDWNDDDYLARGADAMKDTGDKTGQYARYNSGTDSRKALDIAHLNLDDYYGSHITGSGLPNKGSAYSYDASALKVLPKDIGKLSTNEQMDTPAQTRANYKAQRRSLGLPDIIPTLTQPSAPHEVEQEQEAPPEGGVGDPHAKPKASEADIQAERMNEASARASSAGEASVGGISSVAGGDAGGTVRFTKEEELDSMRSAGGRTINTNHPAVKRLKGSAESVSARAKEASAPPKDEDEGEEQEASSAEDSRAGGGGAGRAKSGHKFYTRKEELEKAFPGIKDGRKNGKETTYGTLTTGQQKFLVAIAQGKPGKPSEDLMENYSIDQGAEAERQHDYMAKMIDAHDKANGKKGLEGYRATLREVADEIPSLSLAKLFSLSSEGRDIVYQSVKAPGTGTRWKDPQLRSLTDHDLDVLLALYGRVGASRATATRGEKLVASSVGPSATEETPVSFGERMKRLKAKGYEA
jgi:hypothetical protein